MNRSNNRTWLNLQSYLAVLLALVPALPAVGAVPSAKWLPADTKFHLSVEDYPKSKALFDKTEIGRCLNDPVMEPFLKDLPGQLQGRARGSWFGLLWVELGVDWSRFERAARGEVAWALIQMGASAVPVLIADVTGQEDEVNRLREAISAEMAKKEIPETEQTVDGTRLTIYRLPKREAVDAKTIVYFVRKGTFIATESVDLARKMVGWVGVERTGNLAGLDAYRHVMRRCREAVARVPEAYLYAVPFDLLETLHKVARKRDLEVDTSPELFRSQGFDALSAIGAFVLIDEDLPQDFRFVASLYAPKPWSQSMRMVDLRNQGVELARWIAADSSACTVMNLFAQSVYSNLGPLFDEVVADGAEGTWDDILESLRDDVDGPRLDLPKEVFAFLSGPVTVVESETMPVTPESPRILLAIESSNEKALKAGIDRAMKDDPAIESKTVNGTMVYYSYSRERKNSPLWILAVARQHLFMATDFSILDPVLEEAGTSPLSQDADFQRTAGLWRERLAGKSSMAAYYRLDRWLQVRYELFRAGKSVARAKSLNGLLNGFLGGEPMEEDTPSVDGSKLPPYEAIRKYLGILDAAVVSTEKGWFVVGHVTPRD